jgi:Sortase and related acyltransferases
MSITIRTLADGDFFSWLGLYEGYAAFYDTPLTDEKALRVWTWLNDANHEENAFVAVDDHGTLVGLAHYREFTRPLESDRGLFIDDLYVAPDLREQGTGTALIEAVRALAAERGYGVVQWLTAADNETAQRLYDTVGKRTPWVTYEIAL